MPLSRTQVERETARRMRRLGLQNGEDIRRLRAEAGVSLAQVADVVGVHKSHLARIERHEVEPSLEVLTGIAVALGADLSFRFFPGSGPRLHDRFQAPIEEAIIRELDPRWSVAPEVPVTQPSRGVIDLVMTDRASPAVVAAEVQSELRRLEQQIRWSSEKADGLAQRLEREGHAPVIVSKLLILRSTVTTRELARRYEATLAAAYPARTEDVVRALTTPSARWPGAGIVWVRLERDQATLLHHPPRGVALGR